MRAFNSTTIFALTGSLLVAALTGCAASSSNVGHASAPAAAPPAPESETGIRPLLSAEENIDRLARQEAEAPKPEKPSRPDTLTIAALPPGLDPSALALRGADHETAWLSLREALADVARRTDAFDPVPEPAREPDPQTMNQALRFYAQGRDQYINSQFREAIQSYVRALQLDQDNPRILQALGQTYLATGNQSRAIGLFERLLHSEPDDEMALYIVGLAAAERRDFELAAAALGRPRLNDQAFRHDPNASVIADFELARSLDQLGYDQAFVTLADEALAKIEDINLQTRYRREIGSIYRQRADLWLAVGDAQFRLGLFKPALDAYETAMQLTGSDREALLPRVIYASLNQSNSFSAQKTLLDSIREEDGALSDRDILLCAYLRQHGGDVGLLTEAVNEMYASHPDRADLARAAAALLPEARGLKLLEDFIARRPRDLLVVHQLLVWQGRQDVESAVRLAISLVRQNPDLAEAYARHLTHALPRPSAVIEAAGRIEESAQRERIAIGVLQQVGAIGEAWARCTAALVKWPESRLLRICRIGLAAELDEPALVKQSIMEAQRADDIDYLIAASRALSRIDEHRRALSLSNELIRVAPENPKALATYALILMPYAAAQTEESEQQTWAETAVEKAGEALKIDPTEDDAYDVIVRLTGPGGMLADPAKYRQTLRQWEAAHPDSRYLAQIQTREDITRRRFDAALERLINLYQSDPTDGISLGLCVSIWTQLDHLDDAQAWFEKQLQERPGDPGLLEYWTRVQLLQSKPDQAIEGLSAELALDPGDRAAGRLLEAAYRAMGDHQAVLRIREPRLLDRPRGTRRETDLAAMYADAKMPEQSLQRLEWVEAHASDARQDHLLRAIDTARGLEDVDPARRDELTVNLTIQTLDRFPASPLGLYQVGLLSLARLGELDDRFDVLTQRAVSHAVGAMSSSREAIFQWRNIAQGLIDEGFVEPASRVLHARLRADPDFEQLSTLDLAIRAIAADAGTSGGAGRTIELIEALSRSEVLGRIMQGQDSVPQALYSVSQVYSILGNVEGTDELLLKAIELDPTYTMAMNNLAYTRIEAGRSDEKTIWFMEEAYRLLPDDGNVLDSIGWLRYKQGRFEDEAPPADGEGETRRGALGFIQKALGSKPSDNPEVMDHLADTFWRLGDRDRAIEIWKKIDRIVSEPARRQAVIQTYQTAQSQWGLLVVDPEVIYDREEGALLERVRAKIEAVDNELEPPIAPTFAETETRPAAGEH